MLVHTVLRPQMPGCSKHSSISVIEKPTGGHGLLLSRSDATVESGHACAAERARTCAGVGGARYHIRVVQPIPFDAVAEVRAD